MVIARYSPQELARVLNEYCPLPFICCLPRSANSDKSRNHHWYWYYIRAGIGCNFSSMRTLTNLVNRIFDLVNHAFYPEISMAWASHKKELLRRLHRLSYKTSFWLGISAVFCLAIFGPWVFEKWTQGKVVLDMPLYLGFLALTILRSLWHTSYVMPSAINKHQRITIVFLIASAISLGISLALLQISLFCLSFRLCCFGVGL